MRQISRFITVGIASTLAYVGLYAMLRGVFPGQLANALPIAVEAIANEAANRRLSTWIRSVGTVVDYGGTAGTLYDLSGAASTRVNS